jgi:hypothetical protein
MVVKLHISFGMCSDLDCSLVLWLGNTLNKRVGLRATDVVASRNMCQELNFRHPVHNCYTVDRVILAYSYHYRKYA